MPLDVALVQVSPPDRHGFCSLGVSVDVARCRAGLPPRHRPDQPEHAAHARRRADHISNIDSAVVVDDPLHETVPGEPGPAETAIGRYVAELVEDGASL